MRYYSLVLSDTSGAVYAPSASGGFVKGSSGATFTSLVNGQNDPGAPNIEFDVLAYPFDTPQGNSIIRVWGVGLQMIGQAASLAGFNIQLSAGMSSGLPLAKPAQAGIILKGQVYQAFGNWQGVNQTLDLICNPGGTEPDAGFCFYWKAGKTLSSAISATLSQAMPAYKTSIAISKNLTLQNDEAGTYDSLSQFAEYVTEISQSIGAKSLGKSYPGVRIAIIGSTVYVYDLTSAPHSVTLAFEDLIGQPTWVNPGTVSFKTVLRSDIAIGNQVVFPKGIAAPFALTSAAAAAPGAPARNQSVFQGNFVVTEVHHFANLRQPDAESWNTTFTAVPTPTFSA